MESASVGWTDTDCGGMTAALREADTDNARLLAEGFLAGNWVVSVVRPAAVVESDVAGFSHPFLDHLGVARLCDRAVAVVVVEETSDSHGVIVGLVLAVAGPAVLHLVAIEIFQLAVAGTIAAADVSQSCWQPSRRDCISNCLPKLSSRTLV